jgi:hypothetical protein
VPLLDFLILSLATWRISSLLIAERGAFNVFTKLRQSIGIGHDDEGQPNLYPDTLLAELFSCVRCLSVWVAIVLTLVYVFVPSMLWLWLCLPLALSAAAIGFERLQDGKS